VVELTGLLRHSIGGDQYAQWPPDMRLIARREPISPGAQPSLFEQINGYRFQVIATNTPVGQLQRLEARHRVHARVEDRIRNAEDTGLAHLPSREYEINTAWCVAVAIAAELLTWTQLLTLDGPLAKPNRKRCATGCCTPPPASCVDNAAATSNSTNPGPGPTTSPPRSTAPWPSRHPPDMAYRTLSRQSRTTTGSGTGAHPRRHPGKPLRPQHESAFTRPTTSKLITTRHPRE
jgi:hypothetical protein